MYDFRTSNMLSVLIFAVFGLSKAAGVACGPWLWLRFRRVSDGCVSAGFRRACGRVYVLRRVGDEGRTRCVSPGREKRPSRRPVSADHASNRIRTRGSPATLEPFHICFPRRDGESKTLCSLIFSKEIACQETSFPNYCSL